MNLMHLVKQKLNNILHKSKRNGLLPKLMRDMKQKLKTKATMNLRKLQIN